MRERFREIKDPEESYSPWDQGWRFRIAWGASLLVVLLGIFHSYLLLKVVEWWIRNI